MWPDARAADSRGDHRLAKPPDVFGRPFCRVLFPPRPQHRYASWEHDFGEPMHEDA